MLETINCLLCFVGNLFEAAQYQHCASDMIANSHLFAALTSFQARFPNGHSIESSHSLRGVLFYVIRHDIIRAISGMRNPEELHLVTSFDVSQLAMLRFSFSPFKRIPTTVLSQAA